MEFSRSITEIIKERSSWRTYYPELLDDNIKEKLKEVLKLSNIESPFDSGQNKCRFELVSVPEFDPDEERKLGTYGMISGAQEFIVGTSFKSEHYKENFGYLMEVIILKATDLGLGTCWLGGTFNRSIFSQKVQCKEGEIVPAISPIGYPAKRRTREKIIRRFLSAKNRKPWEKMFFLNDFQSRLPNKDLGDYSLILEMVRLGPSAKNGQPWRIVKQKDENTYHFYVKYPERKLYRFFVMMDIGIAVCHFDLTAKDLSITGDWFFEEPFTLHPKEDLKYVITWKGR
jgi:nitroreductase